MSRSQIRLSRVLMINYEMASDEVITLLWPWIQSISLSTSLTCINIKIRVDLYCCRS